MHSKTMVPEIFFSFKFSFTKRTKKPTNPFMGILHVSVQSSNICIRELTFLALKPKVRMNFLAMIINSLQGLAVKITFRAFVRLEVMN